MLPKPNEGGTYFEPFLGGGAIFFALRPEKAVLSDINCELIETFRSVRDEAARVIRSLAHLPYSEGDYYRIRSKLPRESWRRAARFIYLNKTAFNGLFRVNLEGRFNVPFGDHGTSLLVCDRTQIVAASTALRQVRLLHADFEKAVASARKGDLVYFDPPYTTAHVNNGFIEYNARVFSWKDQTRLAKVAKTLVNRNVMVAISNANHRSIRALYRDGPFELHRIDRWSTIAGNASKRFPTSEILITSDKGIP